MSSLLSIETFANALAGMFGGQVAMTLFYPLDQARFLAQTAAVSGQDRPKFTPQVAFRGIVPALQALACSNFVYFYVYSAIKRSRLGLHPLVAAALAGVVNVLTTCPLWVAATKLKVERKRAAGERVTAHETLWSTLARIYEEEGVEGLWSGAVSSLWLVSNPTIQFAAYDSLKTRLLTDASAITDLQAFTLSGLSKMVATLCTYPLQVTQSRLRAQGRAAGTAAERDAARSTLGYLRHIQKTEGLSALFAGLELKLVQTVLSAAFHFTVYERMTRAVRSLLLRLLVRRRVRGGSQARA
jgi:adenine nucleotide transporter 17